MGLIIGALTLGFLLGRVLDFSKPVQNLIGKISSFSVLLLLFTMGITIGANQDIISSLPSLGLQAVTIALGTVVLSVLAVWATVKLIQGKGEGHD